MSSARIPLESLSRLFKGLLASGVSFSLFDEKTFPGTAHYLKHDIHEETASALEIARLERSLGIRSTYFMLHRSPKNEKIYDEEKTWMDLRAIQALGHEVAMHVDGFTLVERYGSVSSGINAAFLEFRVEGIHIRGANAHGNSVAIHNSNFHPCNFYVELATKNECQDPYWNAHYKKCSIVEKGFQFWADSSVWIGGGVRKCGVYFSDNKGDWVINPGAKSSWKHFDAVNMTPDSVSAIVDKVKGGSCLYLIHPQFYG